MIRRVTMAPCCTSCDSSSNFSLLLTLLYNNLLSSIRFLYQYPLHLAYILYFSPYIFQLTCFLFPLLLSTSILLLVLLSLHSMLKDEAAAIRLLDQLNSMLIASTGNFFEWDSKTMGELYRNVGLICEVKEEDPDEICTENSVKTDLLVSHVKVSSFEPEKLNHRATNGELCEIPRSNCEFGEDPLETSSKKSIKSEILESDFGIGDDQVKSERCSFVPQTPDGIPETLSISPLARRAKSVTIKDDFYKNSSPICETTLDPDKKIALSRSQSERVDNFNSRNKSKVHEKLKKYPSFRSKNTEISRVFEGIQRSGSTRKEKEWKRTLACKLYEERMTFKLCEERTVVEGAEEMDLLWEAYESDAGKANKLKNKGKNGKREMYIEEEEEDDEELAAGQLCCLKALKMSSGKMNLGVGRSNLSRISKAFKGFGFLHRSNSRRN